MKLRNALIAAFTGVCVATPVLADLVSQPLPIEPVRMPSAAFRKLMGIVTISLC